MCLVPSRQFYPTTSTFLDSFHSSFSIYHGGSSRLQFFRCHSFLPPRMQNFYATHGSKTSIRAPEQNLQSKFSCVFKEPSRVKPDSGLYDSRGSWLDKWNEYGKQTRLKEPRAMVSYQDDGSAGICAVGDETNSSHRAGGSTMEKIVEKLKKFGYIDGVDKRKGKEEKVIEKGSVEDIFYVEEGMLPNTQGGFSGKVVLGDGGVIRFPWEKSVEREGGAAGSVMKKNPTSLAELTLPESELERLRNLAIRTKNKTKIGGAGVTQALVDTIHEQWKTSEVVRLKIEGPPALNMKRMHEILERKTGGLVIWRSGTSIALYRGVSFEDLSLKLKIQRCNRNEITRNSSSETNDKIGSDSSVFGTCSDLHPSQLKTETTAEDKNDAEPLPEVNYEDEVNQLLDDLGPRYTDWPGYDPIPVDADMLAGDIPGYKPPFRLLPYGVKGNLGEKEATALRRLARGLPPHFALGRGRKLHGLAVAMIKLWEKSMISKIALKRGVQLTTSEKMAEDLKKLTGGVLLSRNKDFLVFYRGKNFLSSKVTEALLERERSAKALQDDEEKARLKASEMVAQSVEKIDQSGAAGTLGETLDADARWAKRLDDHDKAKMMREAKLIRHVNLVRDLECKLAFAERKVIRAERALSKIDESLKPSEWSTDMGSISDEERFMFRKLGLKMKAYLLLGRRGVFDGTVENMHLHWKYRELVKIILKLRNFNQVEKIALSLEAESGGVLVSVDKISKGYAIIVYRGKDYKRPPTLRPKNLLTKRKALARSIELQRHEALSRHVSVLQRRVVKLKSEIEQLDVLEDQEGNDELYDKLDSAYPTDEEETQDEGDGTYLETYGREREIYEEDERSESVNNGDYQTSFPYDANYHKPESKHGVYKQQLYLVTDDIASTRAGEDEENIQLFMNRANL